MTRVVVDVYGSLSLTGKGHHTDIAIIMGLAGNLPDTVDIDSIPGFIQDVNTDAADAGKRSDEVEFPVDQCMNFHADNLSLHENGMRITALAGDKVVYSQTYYSMAVALSLMKSILASRIAHRLSLVSVQFSSRSAKTLSGNRAVTLWPDDEKRAGAAQQRRAGTAPGERLGSHARRY